MERIKIEYNIRKQIDILTLTILAKTLHDTTHHTHARCFSSIYIEQYKTIEAADADYAVNKHSNDRK